MDEIMYCENADCRVELYRAVEETETHYLKKDPVGSINCPGCGQFGRKKGKQ
jgi:hypothetical protein